MRRPALACLVLALLVPAAVRAQGPTVAREDTMSTEVPPVLVKAPRVTLDEILARVARGEARRDSLMRDQSFLATLRVVRDAADPRKPPSLERELVTRVWKKRPDRVRTVVLRDLHPHARRGPRGEVDLGFTPSMDERDMLAGFRAAEWADYRYRIEGRDLLPGPRLVYRIAFEPRSRLDPTRPNGLVWIDTNDFVIVRQELHFDRSPVPMFIKGVRRVVVERQRADGFWVLKRVLVRADTTLPFPGVGRSFDLALAFEDFAVNRGIPDSVFAGTPRVAPREVDE